MSDLDLKLERDKNEEIVLLKYDNVKKVEAMIKENSSYALTLNDEKAICPDIKFLEYLKNFVESAENENILIDKSNVDAFCGSTKWWVEQLDKCENDEYFKILIAGIIHNIDRTNSTHLNARTKNEETGETEGRKQIYKTITKSITDYINKYKATKKDALKSMLKDPGKPLIGEIAEKDDKTGKFNLSFASKFCHYLTWYLYNEDMYSIYDSVIAENLPEYIKHYKITDNDINDIKVKYYQKINRQKIKNFLKNPPFKNKSKTEVDMKAEIHEFYITYMDIIDKIIEEGCNQEHEPQITRRQFDHLVWYCNKGRATGEDEDTFNKKLDEFIKNLSNNQ